MPLRNVPRRERSVGRVGVKGTYVEPTRGMHMDGREGVFPLRIHQLKRYW